MQQSDHAGPAASGAARTGRRPRFAVLGEFSAGKSTLINLLSNGAALKTQVTATQMAPVWLSYGTEAPYRIDLQGARHPYTPGDPVDVDRTAYIRMFGQNTILNLCDLIDTPGNSDPNINPIAWERMVEVADAAIWCSPATQAWRQSERASWREMPARFRKHSLLLLTQSDKLQSDADREKVQRRVSREASDEFQAIFMLSLVEQNDFEGFLRRLINSVKTIRAELDAADRDTAALGRTELSWTADMPRQATAADSPLPSATAGRVAPVMPRRVQIDPAPGGPRPARPGAQRARTPRPPMPEESRIAHLRDGFREAPLVEDDEDADAAEGLADDIAPAPPIDIRRYGNEG